MGVEIKNHSNGDLLGITSDHQALVRSENRELQHAVAIKRQRTFQVISVDTGITAKTQTLLHLKNTDPARKCVVSFIRFQAITNTASKPVVGEYFEVGFGREVASGGTAATPVNTFVGSGRTANVTATGIDPTMSGTFTAIDRWYHQASGDMHTFNKQGSIILDLNDTMEVRFVAAGTGEAMCRLTFMMLDNEE